MKKVVKAGLKVIHFGLLRLLLSLSIFLSASSAHAVVFEQDGATKEYRVTLSSPDSRSSSEATLETKLKQKILEINEFIVRGGLKSPATELSLRNNSQSDGSISLTGPERIIKVIMTEFSKKGLIFHEAPVKDNPVPIEVRDRLIDEANLILSDFANEILVTREGYKLEILIDKYKQRMEQFFGHKMIFADGYERTTEAALSWHRNIDSDIRAEWESLEKAARSLLTNETQKFQEKLEEIRRRQKPLLSGIGSDAVEDLIQAHPHMSNIIREQQDAALHYAMQSPESLELEARIKVAREVLWGPLTRIKSHQIFNTETYEVMAQDIQRQLSMLENEMARYELGDLLNRTLVIWNNPRMITHWGPQARKLFQRMSFYKGIEPFIFVMLQSMAAIQEDGKSTRPSQEVIDAYSRIAADLAFKGPGREASVRTPIKQFGEIYNAVAGTTHVDVSATLSFINEWFQKHGLPTMNWYDQPGISKEAMQTRLSNRRQEFLFPQAAKSCRTAVMQKLIGSPPSK